MATGETAREVCSVWATTLDSYKKDLSRKDLLVVEAITWPTDIANHIEDLEAKIHLGKSGLFADRVHAITSRLTQFSNVIGAITSSNTEASLIWGSLKLLLTIVHQSSEEYEKICRSILAVSESFPIIDLLAETFSNSELVCSHVAAFYTTVLKFWGKALKFYRRRRMFNIFRAWHDFESEFGDLDRDMKRYGKIIGKAAAAVHMNESRTARNQQEAVDLQLIEAKQSAVTSRNYRSIVQWLAPSNHEAGYFVDDLRSASESRHPGTCTWIVDRQEFDVWMKSGSDDPKTRILWLTGVPGAGKTVLSSFVINKCSQISGKNASPPILYFFFKMTDSDKNSVLAATRSLVYQLYSLFPANLCTEIVFLRDESGKENALSDQRLWDLFVKHAADVANLTIVLDALDECNDVDTLLRRMISLLQSCPTKIFVVSRREENLTLALEDYPHIVIGQDDVEADICSYVTEEIGKIPRFQGKPVQRRMISALSSGHGGMFLWAYLMVKELKELGTVRQVDDALKNLPTGLEEMHGAIITRLDSTLHKAHRILAIKILTWIVCAVRPLRLTELQEILRFEIRQGSATRQSPLDDDDLLYSEKDIELACGALVISRNETIQLIHLSTKEILVRKPPHMRSDDSRLAFYVDASRENPHMAMLCVSYMWTHLSGTSSITRPNLEGVSRLNLNKISYDSTDLLTKSPFIDYASISWQAHLIDGKNGLELEDTMHQLQTLLTYDLTSLWIELCVVLHQDIIWTLERSCKAVMSWTESTLVPADSACNKAIQFLWAWSNAVVSIINEYGRVIEEYPYEIHHLDLENVLSNESAPGPAALPLSFFSTQGRTVREQISVIGAVDKFPPDYKVEPWRQLQSNLQDPYTSSFLGFVLYDSTRNVYLSAEYLLSNDTEVLRVQERTNGRRLQPMKSTLNVSCEDSKSSLPRPAGNSYQLRAAILSLDRTYLAILYGDTSGNFVTSIWIIERHLDFLNIRDRRPWARRLHCLGSKNHLFPSSCLPLTVGQDGVFYCPSGKIHPERGIHKRIPDSLTITSETRNVDLAFVGDGQTMIRLDRRIGLVREVSWLEDMVTELLHSGLPSSFKGGSRLKAISQTARFMIYQALDKDLSTVLDYLLYTMLNTQVYLKQLPIHYYLEKRTEIAFHFSKDEKYLLSIRYGELNDVGFSRWAISESGFTLQETKLFRLNSWPRKLCVAEEHSMIIIVDDDRVIYELDLERLDFRDGTLTTFMGSDYHDQHYCRGQYVLSRNGLQVVGIYTKCSAWFDSAMGNHEQGQPVAPGLRTTCIELKFADLSGIADQTRTTQLHYSDPHPSTSHNHVIMFSPDLSILQAGSHIIDLSAPGHRLSTTFHAIIYDVHKIHGYLSAHVMAT